MAITYSSHIGGTGALEPGGSMGITIQDQVTPIVITKFTSLEQSTTIDADAVRGAYTINVASATGIATGKFITIFDPISIRYSTFECVSITDTTVTLDSPIDYSYPSGSHVDVSEQDMAVNGSVTPVVYGVRNNTGSPPPPGIDLSVDITRIIFKCYTSSAPTLAEFGDITALTNGLVLRKRDGEYHNIFNVKDTGDLAGIMFDLDIYTAVALGQDGFISRLTFGGQSKLGAVPRLAINEDLEIIVQDNLAGLDYFEIIAEGSIVQP